MIVDKIRVDVKPYKSRLYKCPLCGGDLFAYSLMGIMVTESCYCPKCNIVREYMMSTPVLCDKCYSRSIYRVDGKYYCWFCDNESVIAISSKEAEEKGLFDTEGYKLSNGFVKIKEKEISCKHEHTTNIRHNDEIFKIICEICDRIEYVFIPKWLQEEKNIGDVII